MHPFYRLKLRKKSANSNLWSIQAYPNSERALFQNPHKFFPEERFGDESPVMALRQSGRCRVNSTPAVESMFTDLETLVGFHPPLPPPPPPYHPPTTPGHSQQQLKAGWRPRVPSQPPSRSFSYPCNHALLHRQPSTKMGSPVYPPGTKPLPPDCTNAQGGRILHPDKQMVIYVRFYIGMFSL